MDILYPGLNLPCVCDDIHTGMEVCTTYSLALSVMLTSHLMPFCWSSCLQGRVSIGFGKPAETRPSNLKGSGEVTDAVH